jgi:hypothetical protein
MAIFSYDGESRSSHKLKYDDGAKVPERSLHPAH